MKFWDDMLHAGEQVHLFHLTRLLARHPLPWTGEKNKWWDHWASRSSAQTSELAAVLSAGSIGFGTQFHASSAPWQILARLERHPVTFSPHLCVGFLFLVLHSRLPRPPAPSSRRLQPVHTQLVHTHNLLSRNLLPHNLSTHTQLPHTQLVHT